MLRQAILNVEKANTSVTLIITANEADEVQFTIQINLSDWKFATSWQYMTGGIFDNLPYTLPFLHFQYSGHSHFQLEAKKYIFNEGAKLCIAYYPYPMA
jgi:hypothetical protein